MGMQVPATWQGIPGQPQLPTQQLAAPSAAALQQPGLVFPIQQYQVNIVLTLIAVLTVGNFSL